MPRTTTHAKDTSFNLRIDPGLKAAFTAATEAEDKPAAQVLRDLMRAYVRRRERLAFEAEARRQSHTIAEAAKDPHGEEAEIMRWVEAAYDDSEWTA